ncbi:hypothetical protein LNQ03_09245 [Klebsiella pneumoniae subsp. pneumoniae]|nr:hypothetical protein [Klebsiella pneumoniae subsp. pneumoniae]
MMIVCVNIPRENASTKLIFMASLVILTLALGQAILGLGGVFKCAAILATRPRGSIHIFVTKNCLATVSNEEKGEAYEKKYSVWVLSFFDAASAANDGACSQYSKRLNSADLKYIY